MSRNEAILCCVSRGTQTQSRLGLITPWTATESRAGSVLTRRYEPLCAGVEFYLGPGLYFTVEPSA